MTAEQGFRYVDPEPPRFEGNRAWGIWKKRRDAFLLTCAHRRALAELLAIERHRRTMRDRIRQREAQQVTR